MNIRFRNRDEAAERLAAEIRALPLVDPLVLAVPRGGVVIGAIIARAIQADLDVVLSRKLRAPLQPELAIGAVSEDGQMHVDEDVARLAGASPAYIEEEAKAQQEEIERRRAIVRQILPHADVRERSVIVTDDGVATGATLRAALRVVRRQSPHELIVAVPVGPAETIDTLRRESDRVVCLCAAVPFWAVGAFYEAFDQISDAQVLEILRSFAAGAIGTGTSPAAPIEHEEP
ncbi:MAG: phosphoribosyltransferase [Planctomycetota bacterium]|jgi:predicted phosphoribosyltransferase